MQNALLVARLALFGVLGIAGVAKLADPVGSLKALVDFGVPGWLARPFAILLPIVELALAAALLTAGSAWLGSIGALVLFLLFISGIAANIALGRRPDCHCFGQLYSAPVGWMTLARNAMLAVVAGFVVWGGRSNSGPSTVSWFTDLTFPQWVVLLGGFFVVAFLAGQGALLWQILRQQGRMLLSLERLELQLTGRVANSTESVPAAHRAGLPVNTQAPAFSLNGLGGEAMALHALVALRRLLILIFTNPKCSPCQALMPDIAGWQREYSGLAIVVISEGTVEENLTYSNSFGITQVLLQHKREVAEMYHAWGTPAGVLVQPDGTIGSPLAQGAVEIRTLVAQTNARSKMGLLATSPEAHDNGLGTNSRSSVHAQGLKFGHPAPSLQLPDLNGDLRAVTNLNGRTTLLLFWNPSCGFCQQMLKDLREWDTASPAGSPELLVISSGTAEETRAMNLRSAVLLDHKFQAGNALGIGGTPMAVLLDEKGQISSEVAAGAQAVFGLMRVRNREHY